MLQSTKRKHDLKAKGMCRNCGKQRGARSRSLCDSCLDNVLAYQREQRKLKSEVKKHKLLIQAAALIQER